MGMAMIVNKKMQFVTLVNRTKRFEAHLSRCQDLHGDFSGDDRQQTKPIALPLAHARGVLISHVVYNHIKN